MDGGGVGGIHAVVDLGSWRRMVEGLQAGNIGELLLEKALDPIDGVLPLGGEDVKVAGDCKVLVLVAGEATPLEIYHETMS